MPVIDKTPEEILGLLSLHDQNAEYAAYWGGEEALLKLIEVRVDVSEKQRFDRAAFDKLRAQVQVELKEAPLLDEGAERAVISAFYNLVPTLSARLAAVGVPIDFEWPLRK